MHKEKKNLPVQPEHAFPKKFFCPGLLCGMNNLVRTRLGRGNNQCKVNELRLKLLCIRTNEKASGTGSMFWTKWRSAESVLHPLHLPSARADFHFSNSLPSIILMFVFWLDFFLSCSLWSSAQIFPYKQVSPSHSDPKTPPCRVCVCVYNFYLFIYFTLHLLKKRRKRRLWVCFWFLEMQLCVALSQKKKKSGLIPPAFRFLISSFFWTWPLFWVWSCPCSRTDQIWWCQLMLQISYKI